MTNETLFDPFQPAAEPPPRERKPRASKETPPPVPKKRGRPRKQVVREFEGAGLVQVTGNPLATKRVPVPGNKAGDVLARAVPVLVGLKAADATVLADIYARLQSVSRARREKIVTALGRLLA